MSEKYKTYPGGVFFVTLTVVGWIDVFTRRDYCDLIVENLNYCINHKNLQVYAFCIMPSHIHLIAAAQEGQLSDILRDFKSYTSKLLINAIETNPTESRKEWLLYMFRYFAKGNPHKQQYQFWQHNNHPIDLYDTRLFQQRLHYLYYNPVEAGLVNEPQNYMYTSANSLCGVKLEEI